MERLWWTPTPAQQLRFDRMLPALIHTGAGIPCFGTEFPLNFEQAIVFRGRSRNRRDAEAKNTTEPMEATWTHAPDCFGTPRHRHVSVTGDPLSGVIICPARIRGGQRLR
jgi:hypothetical protein